MVYIVQSYLLKSVNSILAVTEVQYSWAFRLFGLNLAPSETVLFSIFASFVKMHPPLEGLLHFV